MRRAVQKNKNKQKQEIKTQKNKRQTAIYTNEKAYMNITTVHLSDKPMELDLKLPLNFILRDTLGMSNHEITYLCRASDLLLLTIGSNNINYEMLSLVKRYMPTSVIVYDKKLKNTAKTVGKGFGNIKTCELSMLNVILNNTIPENTNLASTRPFMIPKEISYQSGYLYVTGFMKNGLRSDKVIINGIHEGIIEEIIYNNESISGNLLNIEEHPEQLKTDNYQHEDVKDNMEIENDNISDNNESESENSIELENFDYDIEDDEPLSPECDLINKYAEYRGIRNLKTCNFDDQKAPDHYKNIVFLKNMKYITDHIKNNQSLVAKNSELKMKIRIFDSISENICVIFNLFEYETHKTIHNYDFSSNNFIPENIVIDNGYRIFKTTCKVTRNLSNNVFKIEPEVLNGVVSFIGPITLFGSVSHILDEDINSLNVIKLLNGRAEDRVFFECVELKGKPIKVCKSYVVIKGMFVNKEQVDYFSNIRIESKNGITGFIKKSLGTKGLFKAYFAQPVKHGDSVKMCLYRRIFL